MASPTRKQRFNAIDFLLTMLFFAGLLALFLHGMPARLLGLEDSGTAAVYTLSLKEMAQKDVRLLKQGELVSLTEDGEEIGEITRIRITPSKSKSETQDVVLTLEGRGRQTEKGFLLNNAHFASPGDNLKISCAGLVLDASVLNAVESA